MKTMLAVCAAFVAVVPGFAADGLKDPAALALLRGVELARAKYDNLRVELVMEYADRTERCTLPCLVEQAGRQRRFEQFPGGCLQQGIVTLIDDREVRSYSRKQHADLEIYDMARAVGVSGDIAFDPRILGLGEIIMTADATLRQLLWIETCDAIELVGREELKGIPTWHIKVSWNEATSDFWIEEPSFLVHKRVLKEDIIRVEINSEFDTQNRTFPFPKRVEVTRAEGPEWRRLEVTVKSFDVDQPIPAERFTMKSLDLPVNTMINDYRVSRIMGYWDGEKISTSPVEVQRLGQGSRFGLILIVLNAVVVIALCVIVARRRWKGAQGPSGTIRESPSAQ